MKNNKKGPLLINRIQLLEKGCTVHLRVSPNLTKTSQIPNFRNLLLRKLPKVKYHHCDNGKEFSFSEELRDTELAHAFEHALIDRIADRDKSIEKISGLTLWNWQKDPRYSYRVLIDYKDQKVFLSALSETLEIFTDLIELANTKTDSKTGQAFYCNLA